MVGRLRGRGAPAGGECGEVFEYRVERGLKRRGVSVDLSENQASLEGGEKRGGEAVGVGASS